MKEEEEEEYGKVKKVSVVCNKIKKMKLKIRNEENRRDEKVKKTSPQVIPSWAHELKDICHILIGWFVEEVVDGH